MRIGRSAPAGRKAQRFRNAGFAVAQVICLLTATTALGHSALAADRQLSASVVAAFDFQGKVRFCYDQVPEIIYLRRDKEGSTSVEARSIDGHVRALFQFPGSGDERSLSCSQDGSTVAVLDAEKSQLFILKASEISVYRFAKPLLYSVSGKYSLLSADGSMISMPGDPIHVSGPDVLRQMRFLRTGRDEEVAYFEGGVAYVERDRFLDVYQYSDGWKKQRSIVKPSGFDAREIIRCGSHIVASLGDDNNSRFLTLDEQSKGRIDWLNRIGVRGLLRSFSSLVVINGGYGRCVFPLQAKRDVRHVLLGIITFDDKGIQRFTIDGPPLAWSDDEMHLSKDGCYALFSAFKQVPKIPEFTMRQQAIVAKLVAPGCRF